MSSTTPNPVSDVERLESDPDAIELYRIMRAMGHLAERVGRFREQHLHCRRTGAGRCLLCAAMGRDDDPTGARNMLVVVHAALRLACDFINDERPNTSLDWEDFRRRRQHEFGGGAAG